VCGGARQNAYQSRQKKEEGMSAHTITVTRKWETEHSTIGEFHINDAAPGEVMHGYILERPGPDTTSSGLRLRIPEGTYNLK